MGNQEHTQQTNQDTTNSAVNFEEIITNKLKEVGFSSFDEIKKIKSEYEKLTKQLKEKDKTFEARLLQLENMYKTEKVKSEVLKLANQLGAIDPEDIFIFAKESAKLTENGDILIGDKTVEEFLKELKQKKPHWFRADEKQGSGTASVSKEPKRELSTKEKLAKIFQGGNR